MKNKQIFLSFLLVVCWLLTACADASETPQVAVATETAVATPISTAPPTSTSTPTLVAPTTVAPTAVAPTAVAPTTVAPTAVVPTASQPANQACTDAATFITDLTVPDNTPYLPGSAFVKTWRLQNSGSCTWDGRYQLVFAGGNNLGAQADRFPLQAAVAPGEWIDLSVSFVAPTTPAAYQSDWKLQNPQGQVFGIGANANAPFWVKIVVPAAQPIQTTISGVVYQDGNENGRYDPGEMLMGSREVWLIPGTACQVRQAPLAVAYSDENGRYTLTGNYAGNFCIGLPGQSGLEDVIGTSVVAGETLVNINLKSTVPNGSISGYVWSDYCLTSENGDALGGDCVVDGNGDYHADGMIQPTESNIAGIEVLLQVGSCANNGAVQVNAVTDSTGQYSFGSLLPGTYCVSMNAASAHNAPRLLPGDWTFPARGIWYQELTLQAGANAYSVNFGWDYQLK